MMAKREIEKLLEDLASLVGESFTKNKYDVTEPEIGYTDPPQLPSGKMGIYMFLYEGKFLKIGKAGKNSKSRYTSQHYNPNRANSTLAKSLLNDPDMPTHNLSEKELEKWIKNECYRINILIDADLGPLALGLVEAILHYKYKPKYEGRTSLRITMPKEAK